MTWVDIGRLRASKQERAILHRMAGKVVELRPELWVPPACLRWMFFPVSPAPLRVVTLCHFVGDQCCRRKWYRAPCQSRMHTARTQNRIYVFHQGWSYPMAHARLIKQSCFCC